MNKIAFLALTLLLLTGDRGWAQTLDLASNKTLRVALLLSNPVLVTKRPDGSFSGVAVELGQFIAKKLGAQYQPVTYETTDAFTKSFGSTDWDIAIGPRTAAAEKAASLSPAFMLVENIYVAAPGRAFSHASEVDRPGVRIAVVTNGAPDQYLSTTLKAATLVRIDGATREIVVALREGKADVYGSNSENVQAAANQIPGSKILQGAFRTVNMVIAIPKEKAAGQSIIDEYVKEAKSSGLIKKVIEGANLKGVRVAD